MGFELLNVDKFIQEKNAKDVQTTNTLNYKGGVFTPDPNGLYSPQIFGTNSKEESEKYGYIDLKTTLMHPLIYKNIKKISGILKKVIDGNVHIIIDNGEIIEVDKSQGKTGLNYLISVFDQIDLDKYKKESNEFFIEFLKKIQKELIFINKIPVIPVLYRPYQIKNGRVEEDEITKEYKKILFNTVGSNYPSNDNNDLLGSLISAEIDSSNSSSDISKNLKLQNIVEHLYNYFIGKLEKKKGFFRSKLIGKRLDNVARLVANARPDVPIDCTVIPWHVLLNLFDIYVIAYLEKNKNIAEDLKVSNYSLQDLGKHLYYIYKNCDIYCKTFPENQEKWIKILKEIFEEHSYLRVLIKRDPGWSSTSFWTLKPIIGRGCQYQIVVPSFYYVPLGGDSFNTNIFYKKINKNKIADENNIVIYNKNNKEIQNIHIIKKL